MSEVPEFYADAVEINLTMPWTVALTFALRSTDAERKPSPVARIRMSPEHAKVTAMILRRQLKRYEKESGSEISLPADVYSKLGLVSFEDW